MFNAVIYSFILCCSWFPEAAHLLRINHAICPFTVKHCYSQIHNIIAFFGRDLFVWFVFYEICDSYRGYSRHRSRTINLQRLRKNAARTTFTDSRRVLNPFFLLVFCYAPLTQNQKTEIAAYKTQKADREVATTLFRYVFFFPQIAILLWL